MTEDEIDLLTACLQFAHLNRQQFYAYLREHQHIHTINYMENNDHNELRIKLSDMYPNED